MNICVIPARGGSKRIPRKNIRLFRGKPMIGWSIEAAQASGCFQQIIVSTDDPEIACVASSFGADVPFVRPVDLSNDYANTQAVIEHAFRWIETQHQACDYICCLYATAPFVQPTDLINAEILIKDCPVDTFVFSATSYSYPIQRAVRLNKHGYASMFSPQYFDQRSQDLEDAFHDAGQFYWASPSRWLGDHNLFEGSRPLLLPRWRVQDIDNEEDWKQAELLHQLLG